MDGVRRFKYQKDTFSQKIWRSYKAAILGWKDSVYTKSEMDEALADVRRWRTAWHELHESIQGTLVANVNWQARVAEAIAKREPEVITADDFATRESTERALMRYIEEHGALN